MHTNTIPSKVIKKVTRYKYSHVALSLEEDCFYTFSFGRRKVNSILHSGFVKEKQDGDFFKKFNNTICKIYEVRVSDFQYNQIKGKLYKMHNHMYKYNYDYYCIIPRFLGFPIRLKNKYVCSYFVASILDEFNVCKFNKNVCLVKPQDFENIDNFKEIYSGKYLLYKKA